MRDGTQLTKHVEHAVGNVERPMSDADLQAKLRDLANRVIPPAQTERLIGLCLEFDRLSDCRALLNLTRPERGAGING
jgi:2-methylcitrate dehydratase PrpD